MRNGDKRYVVVDCDPGTDDAMAIMMLAADERFELVGLCPVIGNRPLKVCEENAKLLLEFIGRTDIPILKGAVNAMFREPRVVSAVPGLGDAVLPEPQKQVEDEYAWDFLYRKAKEYSGKLEILAIGPLTNLGIAFTKYPDLKNMIRQIVIMGGAQGPGNHGTVPAEFNIWADPEAAKIVFKSNIPCALMPYEICTQVRAKDEAVMALYGEGDFCSKAADMIGDHGAGPGRELCDAVAAAYMIDPEMITCEHVHVDVETKGKLTEGKTVFTRRWTEHEKRSPNCYMGVSADEDKFTELVINTVHKLAKQQEDM